MQKSAPCGEYKQGQRKREHKTEPNSYGMWKAVLHSIYPKILGAEATRFGRRGNLIEIKDTPANGDPWITDNSAVQNRVCRKTLNACVA
jgi:hypothetical protein